MIKVLLVDDTPPNRILYSKYLSALGFAPICASDGLRGLACLEDNPDIAAVLSDCQMPNMEGPEMVRAIRKKYGEKMPVIVYSAFLPLAEVRKLLEQGATAFLNFPVTRENLGEYLARYLA
jgi:CheY-like chemotaxis protein